jgi:SagB-type dehydrogenase family enzyme
MASFLERYHERTKYDPRTLDRLGGVDWSARPQPWKDISGNEREDIRSHLAFLENLREGNAEEWMMPQAGRLDLAGLSRLSWFAAGVSGVAGDQSDPHLYRTTPSAGGLYPVELYWIVLDVKGMAPGIWHFHSPGFSLIPVWKGAFRAEAESILLDYPLPAETSAVAILTGIFSRGSWRYGERAYRRVLLDAGHLAGNLLAAAAREGLDAVGLSGFRDQPLSDLLFPDSDEVPLLVLPVGGALASDWPRAWRSPLQPPSAIPQDISSGKMQEVAHGLGNIQGEFERPPAAAVPSPVRGGFQLPGSRPPSGIVRASVERRSCRAFRPGEVPLEAFSSLLAWGAIPPLQKLSPPGLLRTWIVALSVEGLDPGIHRLHEDLTLELVRSGSVREECRAFSLGQDLAADAAFLVIHTTPLAEAVAVLGERAYRPLCMDAGHHGERLNIAAEALGLGASGIGGYFDDMVNETLGLDLAEAILYVTTIGMPA